MTQSEITRRGLFSALAGAGIGTVTFQRALIAQAEKTKQVTPDMIEEAEWIAGIELTEDQRRITASSMNSQLRAFKAMREVKLDNGVSPAMVFQPETQPTTATKSEEVIKPIKQDVPKKPKDEDELAFLTVTELSALVRTKKISSVELTKLYLKRLKKYDPTLLCVVNYTEELALKQAAQADREIAKGQYRGPLHGIPWGAKDLIAYPGYPTTWGASPYKDRVIDTKATVAERLEKAGAVMVAKLSLGALAMGDQWFKGRTNNPWNKKQGSSGSSAGSACATAGGLVGFALGSETLGSIVSPSKRCGNSALRPTFGRVSRHGCMALSWSMDKIGPFARSIEDCALIFGAIHGADGLDPTAVDRPFHWPMKRELRSLKVGFFQTRQEASQRNDLKVLDELGVKLIPLNLPNNLPISALQMILFTEAATAFDEQTRQGLTEGFNNWPKHFQRGQLIPAVEYLRANRLRTLLMEEMRKVMKKVDCYVGGNDLLITNLTGHPTIVMPGGFYKQGDIVQPFSVTFTGQLHGESELLALGHAYQQATNFHRKHPNMSLLLKDD